MTSPLTRLLAAVCAATFALAVPVGAPLGDRCVAAIFLAWGAWHLATRHDDFPAITARHRASSALRRDR